MKLKIGNKNYSLNFGMHAWLLVEESTGKTFDEINEQISRGSITPIMQVSYAALKSQCILDKVDCPLTQDEFFASNQSLPQLTQGVVASIRGMLGLDEIQEEAISKLPEEPKKKPAAKKK